MQVCIPTGLIFTKRKQRYEKNISTLRIDYPQGEGSLPMAVRKFVAHELSQLSLTANCTEEGNKKTADYSGSLDKAQQLVDFYGKCNMDFLVSMQKEVYEGMSGQKPEYAPRFNNELSLKKAYECEQYLTYAVLGYTYLGGAHGSAIDYHVNINKATGKPLTETVDTLKLKELQPILKKGIVSYIAPQDSEVTEKNLKNYLFLGENGLIPHSCSRSLPHSRGCLLQIPAVRNWALRHGHHRVRSAIQGHQTFPPSRSSETHKIKMEAFIM